MTIKISKRNGRAIVPKFDTEAEEAKWWYDNRRMVERDLVRAIADGTGKEDPPAG